MYNIETDKRVNNVIQFRNHRGGFKRTSLHVYNTYICIYTPLAHLRVRFEAGFASIIIYMYYKVCTYVDDGYVGRAATASQKLMY